MMRRALAAAGVLLSFSLLACSGDSELPTETDDASTVAALRVSADNARIQIRDERSLLVTNPKGFSRVEERFSFGRVLGDFGGFVINELADKDRSFDRVAPWIRNAFESAQEDFAEHNDAKAPIKKLGIVDNTSPWKKVIGEWPALNRNGDDVGRGPFRLLAVVNRLDLAGDLDFRATVETGQLPKTMGEGRLVFGFVDPDLEKRGKASPTTFIVEFRLPALNADYDVEKRFDFEAAAHDPSIWRVQLERWGRVWRELSRWQPNEKAYQDYLYAIVQRFAQPENFIGVRASAIVRNDAGKEELELREWYVLRQSWALIKRKPRDEPYRCIARGPEIRAIVDRYWDEDRKDVNMTTPARFDRETSFTLPRAVGLDEPRYDGCFEKENTKSVPYGMEVEGQFATGRRMFLAPFGRTSDGEVWPLAGASEAKRHAFAIRTCTGCHSAEAGLKGDGFGFHVRPRLDGEASELSKFLTGGATFESNGTRYEYGELAKRARFVGRAADRDETLQMSDGLWRSDVK